MMQKRKLSSLLLISFIVIFAFSYATANNVTFETKSNLLRCTQGFQKITVAPTQEITGFEIVFEVVSGGAWVSPLNVAWTTAVPAGWYKAVDLAHVDGVAPDTIRMIALRLAPSLPTMTAGSYDVANVAFTTDDVCEGTVTMKAAQWSWSENPTGTIKTQFTNLAGGLVTVAVTNGTLTVANNPPTIDAITDKTIHWGDPLSVPAVGHDLDPTLCEALRYSLITYPSGMTIDSITGMINWATDGEDVCTHTVSVRVRDKCQASAQTTFTVCVQNTAPVITCPADIVIPWGETATGTVTADDPDLGPHDPVFSVVSFDGPGSVDIDANTGIFNWPTLTTSDYTGTFHLCVAVSDMANICDPCSPANADTCCLSIEVVPHQVKIAKIHRQILGQFVDVELTMLDDTYTNYPMGGFDFLIQYDNSALSFIEAKPGQMLVDCGWEYFTYRTGPFGNCGSACPSGMIKVVAIAEYNNGGNTPDCFTNDGVNTHSPQLVVLRFLATNDHTFDCQFVPIRFTWIDCTDNTISNVAGDILFISGEVWDYLGDDGMDTYVEITDFNTEFPTIYGAPVLCDTISDKTNPYRFIKFMNGGIDFVCNDSIDARGDINQDGVAYSIADAVMYSRYFVYGLTALVNNPGTGYAASIAASDVNADGLTLTVADLVYLIRVVVGDALPYPKEVVSVNVDLKYSQNGTLSVPDNVEMGAARVVLRGNVVPELLADNMEIEYAFDGQNTNLIVWSREGQSFSGAFLQADADVVEVEMATADGSPVAAKLIPTEYALDQNYPNPFNPTTTIQFALPVAGDYTLTIYNVQGQVVQQFTGSSDAGVQKVEWNASNNASGVYFYKLNAGSFTATKKMVLLK